MNHQNQLGIFSLETHIDWWHAMVALQAVRPPCDEEAPGMSNGQSSHLVRVTAKMNCVLQCILIHNYNQLYVHRCIQ